MIKGIDFGITMDCLGWSNTVTQVIKTKNLLERSKNIWLKRATIMNERAGR